MTYRHLKSFIFFCFVLYFNSHQRYFQLKGEWMYNCLWLIFKKCPGFCKKNASYLQMILFWSMLQSGMRIWNKNISRFCLNSRKRFKNIKLWIFLTTKNALKKLKKDKIRGKNDDLGRVCLAGFRNNLWRDNRKNIVKWGTSFFSHLYSNHSVSKVY